MSNNKNNHPRISIVMVCFNAEKYILEAIDSVINQDYSNIEFIVVDGASTDATVDLVQSRMENIDLFISEPDNGQSDAFNKGFSLATGDWMTWLNADDILLPGAIASLVESIVKFPEVDCFTGNVIWADSNSYILYMRKGERWSDSLPSNGVLNVYGPTTFFKRELFHNLSGFDVNLHYQMDTDLWWRFYKSGAKFKRLSEYIWMLRVHEGAKTTAQYFSSSHPSTLKIKRERGVISERYGIKVTKLTKVRLIIYRLLSFNYIKSVLDSVRYNGKNLNSMFKVIK